MLPAIGYTIREANRPILDDPAITGAEVTFEQADDPLRVDRYAGGRDFDFVSVHALKLSVASAEPPRQDYLDALRDVAVENGASAISDHLGFTRHGKGAEIGHFCPPPFTPAAADAACRNIDRIQRHFRGVPFYLENIASLSRFQGGMSEPEFLIRILERTGCGWLLDVANVYANARNHGYDARAFIYDVMPAAPRLEMHLAGGFYDERAGRYIDSHSRPVPDEVWDLYRYALRQGRGKVDAVFIERDHDFPDEAGWRSEVRQARQIALDVEAVP